MRAFGYHRCPEVMRTAGHIRDYLGLLRIRDGRFEHADDRAGAITLHSAKLNRLPDNRRISPERVRPETIGENNNAGSLGTVILRSDQASEHRTQSHHIEIRPVDYAAIDFARLAQPADREIDSREVTKFPQRLDPSLQVLNFQNRPRIVFGTCARRALPDINQPVFIAIDQGLDEHAPHEGENGGVGANAECQRDDYDKRETWRFAEAA